MKTNKTAFRGKRKTKVRDRRDHLRKRKPRRQGSRSQAGKRLPAWLTRNQRTPWQEHPWQERRLNHGLRGCTQGFDPR